jgi:GAF domain-containing protein
VPIKGAGVIGACISDRAMTTCRADDARVRASLPASALPPASTAASCGVTCLPIVEDSSDLCFGALVCVSRDAPAVTPEDAVTLSSLAAQCAALLARHTLEAACQRIDDVNRAVQSLMAELAPAALVRTVAAALLDIVPTAEVVNVSRAAPRACVCVFAC